MPLVRHPVLRLILFGLVLVGFYLVGARGWLIGRATDEGEIQ